MDIINAVHKGHSNDDTITGRKNTWTSLPTEIKKKVVKYVSLTTRNGIKRVCKQWLEIVTDLNNLETKLVLLDETDGFELPGDANSLCNLARHQFDRTSIIRLHIGLAHMYRTQIVKNFPNLLALYLSDDQVRMAFEFAQGCPNLEHLSFNGEFCTILDSSSLKRLDLSCLHDHYKKTSNIPVHKFENLKFFNGHISDGRVFKEMLDRGLLGFPVNCSNSTDLQQHALSIEVLYNVEGRHVDSLCQMPKLTTIYGMGELDALASLEKLTGLTKLSWKAEDDEVDWTADLLSDAFKNWGHRLRSLRIAVDLLYQVAIQAVVETCPNLEEFHIEEVDQEGINTNQLQFKLQLDLKMNRNCFCEFKLLKQLTKLKTLSIDFFEVDVKFLKMFDPEVPELESMAKLGLPMAIEQLIRYQFEITERKSLTAVLVSKICELDQKDKRIRERAQTKNS